MSHRFACRHLLRLASVTLTVFVLALPSRADEVTDWTQIMLQAAHTANIASTITQSRSAAIVEVSIYDSVNGIRGRHPAIHVSPGAPRTASPRAAAVQAAYASLIRLYPAQQSTFDAARAASLANLMAGANEGKQRRHAQSIAEGIAWGQQVADAIWIWRSTDGFAPPPPPFLGGDAPGEWRPTPPAFAPGASPQFATMTPWVLITPDQFRPGAPPALSSALYAQNVHETESRGSLTSTVRTAEETAYARFWATSTPVYNWNSVALSLEAQRHRSLLGNARLFAALNLALADAGIALWDAKFHYVSWRPVTAITLADTDGNPATVADPAWLPLIVTPAHPEYPSAHSGFSSAATTVLAHFFGDRTPFVVSSDALPGTVRTFPSFQAARAEIANARIAGGLHFRTSCEVAESLGARVAGYVLDNNFRRLEADDHDND